MPDVQELEDLFASTDDSSVDGDDDDDEDYRDDDDQPQEQVRARRRVNEWRRRRRWNPRRSTCQTDPITLRKTDTFPRTAPTTVSRGHRSPAAYGMVV